MTHWSHLPQPIGGGGRQRRVAERGGGMEGVGGGLRMGGESTTEPGCQARPSSPVHTFCWDVFFCCRLDVMQTLLAAHRGPAVSPLCPACPDSLMHWARQARRGVPGLHLLMYDHKMLYLRCFPFMFCSATMWNYIITSKIKLSKTTTKTSTFKIT